MRVKAIFQLVVLACALLALPVHSRAIVVWSGGHWESELGDFFIYNDTDAQVQLVPDKDWGHHGIVGDPNPMEAHSAKSELDLDVRHESDNKGNLYVHVKDDEGTYTFIIWAHTASHGMTWFSIRSEDSDFQSSGMSSSGAVGIGDSEGDENQRVAQLYREPDGKSPGYVVTFYACANKDRKEGDYTGNGMIILHISRNDHGRFNLLPVNSGDPPWWNPKDD